MSCLDTYLSYECYAFVLGKQVESIVQVHCEAVGVEGYIRYMIWLVSENN